MPSGALKKELMEHLAKVPAFVQQLQFSVKNSTVGKAATFNKVDTGTDVTQLNTTQTLSTLCVCCLYYANMRSVARGEESDDVR